MVLLFLKLQGSDDGDGDNRHGERRPKKRFMSEMQNQVGDVMVYFLSLPSLTLSLCTSYYICKI